MNNQICVLEIMCFSGSVESGLAGGTRSEQVRSFGRCQNPGMIKMLGPSWRTGREMRRGNQELFRKKNLEKIVLS